MSDTYYIKHGKRYVSVGEETPRFLSDGIWLVKREQKSQQRIAKLGELKDIFPYAHMAQDVDILATYLRALFSKYVDDTIRVSAKGCINYSFPSAHDMAQDVLKFLSLSEKSREKHILEIIKECKYIDYEGTVRNLNGDIAHKQYTAEAAAYRVQQLKDQLAKAEKDLGRRLLEQKL
jgi:hypothetical protein